MSNPFNNTAAPSPADGGHPWDHFAHRFGHAGPPLPAKLIAVGAAFLLFKPLGLALLVYFLWNARRHGSGFGPGGHRNPRRSFGSRNSAMEERRQETLSRLAEEEAAFRDFEIKRHQAEDSAAFDRFMSERGSEAPKS